MNAPEPRNHMYLRSEIRDMLTAIALVMRDAEVVGADAAYAAGYLDALRTVAASFGVELPPAHDGPVQR